VPWHFLRLFLESVQEDHLTANDAEDDPRNSTSRKTAAHLPQATLDVPAVLHPDWPTELDLLNVLADDAAIILG
jgi:hypothetical protein